MPRKRGRLASPPFSLPSGMSYPSLGIPQAWSRVARDYQRYIAPDFLPAARAMWWSPIAREGDAWLPVEP